MSKFWCGSLILTSAFLLFQFYYALYDFEATNPHALSVKYGQVVNVLQRQDLDGNKEWWYVENRHGAKGFVPANYLNPYGKKS